MLDIVHRKELPQIKQMPSDCITTSAHLDLPVFQLSRVHWWQWFGSSVHQQTPWLGPELHLRNRASYSCRFNKLTLTFPVYADSEVKSDSVQSGGDDIEVGQSSLDDQVLLGTGQSRHATSCSSISAVFKLYDGSIQHAFYQIFNRGFLV